MSSGLNNILFYATLAGGLTGSILLYFKVARHYHIVDYPNARSSHLNPTIRGGGIVFFTALIFWFIYRDFQWPLFFAGAVFIALISFLDDIKHQPAFWRILSHVIAVILLFYQVQIFSWPVWLLILALIISTGALNAFNFMDGINGITGTYALVNLATFQYVNEHVIQFTDDRLVVIMIISAIVFLFFNFRTRAILFAGDVGSVTMAFVQIFLLLQLIQASDNYWWVILFLVFGMDSVVTIIHRLWQRENIFTPHRKHLYQILSNEWKLPQLMISLCYGLTQFILNAVLTYSVINNDVVLLIFVAGAFVMSYVWMRSITLSRIHVKAE